MDFIRREEQRHFTVKTFSVIQAQIQDCPTSVTAGMDNRKWLLLALALLPAIPCSANFEVTSPQNVVGVVGQDTILPCTVSSTKPVDNLEVQWRKITDRHPEDIYRYRQSGGEPMQKYHGRTSMPGDGFATGNVSLMLENVQPADEGIYNCMVISGDWSADTAIKLSIAGTGEMFLEILGPQGQGLELGCRSHGWFPKPTVRWVTDDGQGLSADTEIYQDSRKFFSVWSRVTVTGEQVGKVTCQTLNPLVQTEKKTTVRLSGAVFPHISPWFPAFWTLVILFLLVLAAGAVKLFHGRKYGLSWNSCRVKEEKPFHAGRSLKANTREVMEYTLEKDLQPLFQQIKSLGEDFRNGQESLERRLQLLSTDLEKKQGRMVEDLQSMCLKESQERYKETQGLQQALKNVQESVHCDLQLFRTDVENELGRSLKANTREVMEYTLEKDLQPLFQQIKSLGEDFRNGQESLERRLQLLSTDLEKKQGRMVEDLQSMCLKESQERYKETQGLQQALKNVQESVHCDLQLFRTDVENELGRIEETNKKAVESMCKNGHQEVLQKIQALHEAFQNRQEFIQQDLQLLRIHLENKRDLSKLCSYKGDVTLDAATAHPRLEISVDGKRVEDTGVTSITLPSYEKRFDSHLFVLAKEGYSHGRHYWEVAVGRRSSWALGIARESVTVKGGLTLSPKNGFWVIGLTDGRDYWAYTDPWTPVSVSGELCYIGIFLDIPAKRMTFYNTCNESVLYTFSIGDGSSQEGKFIPFFSTGTATTEPDPEPLIILPSSSSSHLLLPSQS
ncbi:butyrophilin-like protein 9 isoform X2 [Pithys albifrons albifrons]|uniref:butyrophilin-like protein 9 isoform X2 n=1 Tax=Pithys albifrons albifrons TaxID=3385563 RepID=UPI003A5D0EF2